MRKKKEQAAPPGRPEHKPTPRDRQLVKTLVGLGQNQDFIARSMGIDPKTLRAHYREELDCAKGELMAVAGQTLISKMLGGLDPRARDWRKADTALLIWYSKAMMGWREQRHDVSLTGALAVGDLSKDGSIRTQESSALERISSRIAVIAERNRETSSPTGDDSGGAVGP